MNLGFFTTNSAIFASIHQFCLVLLTLDFLFVVLFLQADSIYFRCFYIVCYTAFSGFMISSFISLYSLSPLFTEIIFSRLTGCRLQELEFRQYLVLPKNTVILFFFFLIIDLQFLIPTAKAKIFNPPAELVIPTNTN